MTIPRLLAALVLVAAACGSTASPGGVAAGNGSDATTITVDQVAESPREDVPSALVNMTADDLPEPLVEPSEIISGGPPPDGIPSIDEPRFLHAEDVDFLEPREPVLAVDIDGDARAYPVQIMMWHEIVNDTVGGVPVSVTYCPLCNSAVVVDRNVEDRVVTFGTSGSLYQSAMVMYDRTTESLWSHFTGEAIAGVLTGTVLEQYPVALIGWSDWLEANPDGLVLSRDTGFDRDYGRNPYVGYDDVDNPPFLFDGEADDRFGPKERVVGVGLDADPTAILLDTLLEEGVIHLEVDGEPIVVWALPGTASALEGTGVADGRDVGTTGAFLATHDGQVLTFERSDDGFVDAETGTRWNVLGRADEGPLTGERLEGIEHLDTFWFAWAAFAHDTRVFPE